jgi:hypothetical protein
MEKKKIRLHNGSSKDEVREFFETYNNGAFAKRFQKVNGDTLMSMDKDNLKEITDDSNGIHLWNMFHKQTRGGTTASHQR